MAGFKYRKFTITGGSAEFPTSTSDANIRSKEEYLVKHVADALIDMGIGWACDTTRNATTSDFVDVPKYSSSTAAPGLFLVNSVSGCKFFLSYLSGAYSGGLCFYDSDGTTKIFDDSQVCTIYNSSRPTFNTNVQGFLMSMLPENSTNNFGASFNASFLPSDATRIIGTAVNAVAASSASYLYIQNLVNNVTNGSVATVQVFATPYCVGIGNSSYGSAPYLASFCGRILGDLTNPTADTTDQAKYGVFTVTRSTNGSSSSYPDYNTDTTSRVSNAQYQGATDFSGNAYAKRVIGATPSGGTYNSNPVTILNYFSSSSSFSMYMAGVSGAFSVYSTLPGNSVCLADGTWICNTASHGVTAQVNGFPLICEKSFDATSNTRPWQPIAMIVVASDTTNDWAGIKGYLDTSLFRASPQFAAGTVLDNGNFVCTDQGMITLGWDPSNPSW